MASLRILVTALLLTSAACGESEELDVGRYCDALVSCMAEEQGGTPAQSKDECLQITAQMQESAADQGCDEELTDVLVCVTEPLEACGAPIADVVAECVDETNDYNACLQPEG